MDGSLCPPGGLCASTGSPQRPARPVTEPASGGPAVGAAAGRPRVPHDVWGRGLRVLGGEAKAGGGAGAGAGALGRSAAVSLLTWQDRVTAHTWCFPPCVTGPVLLLRLSGVRLRSPRDDCQLLSQEHTRPSVPLPGHGHTVGVSGPPRAARWALTDP